MAIFGNSSNTKEVKGSATSTTIITKCMEIRGDIKGCGIIHIDGTVHGNLIVDENIIIGTSGVVHGSIKSKKIMISGKLEGSLVCDTLEVTKTGLISDKIKAKNIVSDGKLNATVLAEETIHITENGHVDTKRMQAKHITVNGHITGDVTASELLEINKDGEVKGTMRVKKIKVTEGGLMLGSMLTYDASDTVKVDRKEKVLVENSKEQIKNHS